MFKVCLLTKRLSKSMFRNIIKHLSTCRFRVISRVLKTATNKKKPYINRQHTIALSLLQLLSKLKLILEIHIWCITILCSFKILVKDNIFWKRVKDFIQTMWTTLARDNHIVPLEILEKKNIEFTITFWL